MASVMKSPIIAGLLVCIVGSASAQVVPGGAVPGGVAGGYAGGAAAAGAGGATSGGTSYQGSAPDLRGSGLGSVGSAPNPTNPDGSPISSPPPSGEASRENVSDTGAVVAPNTVQAATPDLQVVPPPEEDEPKDDDGDSEQGDSLPWWQIIIGLVVIGLAIAGFTDRKRT